jgi:hypothetical protein
MLGNVKHQFAVALCAVIIGVVPVAWAGFSTEVLTVEACIGNSCFGYSVFTTDDPRGQLVQEGDTWTWTLLVDVPIVSFDGQQLLGTLQAGDTNVHFAQDPSVNLNFAVESGPAPSGTTFTIKSALLTFPTINNATARASAAFTLTDGVDEDGASLTPLNGAPGSYMAQYNGFVPTGTTFTQLIPSIVADPLGTASVSEDYPGGGNYLSVGGPVSDISSQVSFLLSPNDLASGTSVFEVIPEPSALLLLAAGLALVRRRG